MAILVVLIQNSRTKHVIWKDSHLSDRSKLGRVLIIMETFLYSGREFVLDIKWFYLCGDRIGKNGIRIGQWRSGGSSSSSSTSVRGNLSIILKRINIGTMKSSMRIIA
jgi:hypothetical protein